MNEAKRYITLPNGNTVRWTRESKNRDEPLTTLEIRDAYDLYFISGMPLVEVADMYDGRSVQCMRYYFKQLGLPSKSKLKPKMTTKRIKEAYELYRTKKHSLRELAKMYDNRTPQGLRYYFQTLGLPLLKERAPKPTRKCKHPRCTVQINSQNRKYCSNACSHHDRYMGTESVAELRKQIKRLEAEVKYLKLRK